MKIFLKYRRGNTVIVEHGARTKYSALVSEWPRRRCYVTVRVAGSYKQNIPKIKDEQKQQIIIMIIIITSINQRLTDRRLVYNGITQV